jgi:hypothetical protein
MVVHASKASAVGRKICLKLKDIIPRQLVEVQMTCYNLHKELTVKKNAVFWVVMLCGSCKNQRFGGTYHLHHQGDKNRQARNNISSN